MSTVRLSDLNDFISPGAACVNPLYAAPVESSAAPTQTKAQPGGPKLALQLESDAPASSTGTARVRGAAASRLGLAPPPAPQQQQQQQQQQAPPKKAQIKLSDCLACSGCVTSAEAVLVEAQSVSKFLADVSEWASRPDASACVRVATISPQARASLAQRFRVTPAQVMARLERALRTRYGFACLLDAGQVFHDVSLLETAAEFVARFQSSSSSSSSSLSSSSTAAQASTTPRQLPLLSSSCPGWVCYAEKTHPEVLPLLSTAKSAQQVAGALVKRVVGARWNVAPSQIYHVTIMQCADKKLEAARPEFAVASVPDVDLVLTATEAWELMAPNPTELPANPEEAASLVDASFAALAAVKAPHDDGVGVGVGVGAGAGTTLDFPSAFAQSPFDALVTGEESYAGGSGGYLAFVFRYAAKQLFNVDVPAGPLPLKAGRNPDTFTLELEIDGRVVLSFLSSYGFRNVQDVVRKLRRGAFPHHFVEMMACPGGCPNGGGQLEPVPIPANVPLAERQPPDVRRRLLAQAVHGSMSTDARHRSPLENPAVAELYRHVVGGDPFVSPVARELFHLAQYKAVPKLELTPEGEAAMAGW